MKRNIGRGGKRTIRFTPKEQQRRLAALRESVVVLGKKTTLAWSQMLDAKFTFQEEPSKANFKHWRVAWHRYTNAAKVSKRSERLLDKYELQGMR